MKIIQPFQISSEILNLINRAKKYIVLVSPYVNFNNWEGIKQEIEKAKQRGVKIEFITRFEVDNNKSWEQIKSLGIEPKLVKNLHAKLYYNETSGIVTSMNLLTSSNLSAIEFGAIYDTKKEIQELKYYVKEFLIPHLEKELPNDNDLFIAKEKFIIILENYISNTFSINAKCRWYNDHIEINANNRFTLGLDKVKKNMFLYGIISKDESKLSKIFIEYFKKSFKEYDIYLDKGELDIIITSKKKYTSDNFNFLKVFEKKEILDITVNFIGGLLDFKKECYDKRNSNANVIYKAQGNR